MNAFVFGGASSGKSLIAETLACVFASANDTPLVYLATMQPYGEVGRKRVERHRAMREGKGFSTVECYGSLNEVEVDPSSTVLLECLGNLVANLQFDSDYQRYDDDLVLERAIEGYDALASRCEKLVVVSNDVGCGGIQYADDTKSYVEVLGKLNNAVAQRCETVYEVVAGVPVVLKEATLGRNC